LSIAKKTRLFLTVMSDLMNSKNINQYKHLFSERMEPLVNQEKEQLSHRISFRRDMSNRSKGAIQS
jgi:hypothetical protein